MGASTEWETTNTDQPLVSPDTAMDIADTGIDKSNGVDTPESGAVKTVRFKQEMPVTSILLPSRPILQRNQPQPPPPQQPPPPPVPLQQQDPDGTTDSLSLSQLKRLVNDMPRLEPVAYAFNYQDTASFPDELDEWFSYAPEEQESLIRAKSTFEERWRGYCELKQPAGTTATAWTASDSTTRQAFIKKQLADLAIKSAAVRADSLETLLYLGLGNWAELAEEETSPPESEDIAADESDGEVQPSVRDQLLWMRRNAGEICSSGGAQPIFDAMATACQREW